MKLAFNAAIDDLDLDPVEFRVYCHILRRGECWESMTNGAKHCKISERTYRRAVHRLIYDHALVAFTERPGLTNVYKALSVGEPNQAVPMPSTPPQNDRAPLADLTGPPVEYDRSGVSDLTGPPLAFLTDKVLPIEVEQEKEDRAPIRTQKEKEAFQEVARIVRSEVGFLSKRDFDFEQAVETWGGHLPELWKRAKNAPRRKPNEPPIWRFQDACERKLDLGLEPPTPQAPAKEPDENGIILGEIYWDAEHRQKVRPVDYRRDWGLYAVEVPVDDMGDPVNGRYQSIPPEYLQTYSAQCAA